MKPMVQLSDLSLERRPPVVARFDILLLAPVLTIAEINPLGRLTGFDLFSLALLPVHLQGAVFHRDERTKWFVLLAGVWALATVVAALWNAGDAMATLRSLSKVLVITSNVLAISWIVRGSIPRMLVFLVIFGASSMAKALLFPDDIIGLLDEQGRDFWKFGMGNALNIIVLSVVSLAGPATAHGRLSRVPATLVLALASLSFNARGLFAILMGTLTLEFAAFVTRRRPPGPGLLLQVALLVVAGLLATKVVYEYAASSGFLGADALAKYEMQSSGDINLLVAGRSELLVSFEAIAMAPLLGHGPGAENYGLAIGRLVSLDEAGLPIDPRDFEQTEIPAHSHLLGSWVEAGILGGVFWIYILTLVPRAILAALANRQMLPIFAYLLVGLAWDILFSPITIFSRTNDPVAIAAALLLLRDVRAYASGRREDR
ncbi:hypothetical protein [Sinorhizobium sp. BG8]|uniref:hypothetical protein n=1 Tax=Sinorhizobium sp. BG8 TaxID=2613773 RepID=UPI00193C95B0|nr:hypothetical protein [Sinorhizobium sp. BG8]QRM56454.1 hypothetical protein F3Y30_19360 [Sinorhizobium sp. BG8]